MADKPKTEELMLEARNFFNFLKKTLEKTSEVGKTLFL